MTRLCTSLSLSLTHCVCMCVCVCDKSRAIFMPFLTRGYHYRNTSLKHLIIYVPVIYVPVIHVEITELVFSIETFFYKHKYMCMYNSIIRKVQARIFSTFYKRIFESPQSIITASPKANSPNTRYMRHALCGNGKN